MTEKKINFPQKGAGRKWAARLKELGQQRPPENLIKNLINAEIKRAAKRASTMDKETEL